MSDVAALEAQPPAIVPEYWAWQADQRLRHAERVLSVPSRQAREGGEQLRFDKPTARPLARDTGSERTTTPERSHVASRTSLGHDRHASTPELDPAPPLLPVPDESQTTMGLTGWFIVCGSVSALTCGTLLMFWSIQRERPELWQYGLPIMIVGQVGLILGIGLQLVARTEAEQQQASTLQGPTPARSATRETHRSRE